MRKDMAKIIVERPRTGGKYDRPGRKATDPDDLPRTESMRRAHKDRKSFSDNLAPLKRFLNSSVGRKWDDVYSEISEHIKGTSTVQRHILQHVFQYVELHVRLQDRKVYKQQSRYGGTFYELWNGDMYVHPETGILKKYKGKRRTRRPFDPFPNDLNNLAAEKTKTEIIDGVVYKVYQDPMTKEWNLRNKANSRHAILDFQWCMWNRRDSLIHFLNKYPRVSELKSVYFTVLKQLLKERLAQDEEHKKAEARKRLINIGDKVEVKLDLNAETWVLGAVNSFQEGYRGKSYMITLDDGSQLRMPVVGSHDKIRKVA